MAFKIAIAGRPNVGKSTLFNRLARRRLALVDKMPGLTRDRREGEADIGGVPVILIDTAGLEEGDAGSVTARMREQTEAGIADADHVLFVVDARSGITPSDELFAGLVRKSGKPVTLLANKCEGRIGQEGRYEAFSLGLGEPIGVSAEHGLGIGDIEDAVMAAMDAAGAGADQNGEPEEGDDIERPLKVAIVGRPNAGKSTLVNALLNEERMITGPEAGITRDSVACELEWDGRAIQLYDTAGLRRRSRVRQRAEQLSVTDALKAIQFAEVVVVLLDADIPFEKQDLTIANLVAEEGRALVIALNKWDQITDKAGALARMREEADRLLPQVRGVPVVALSALRGTGMDRVMGAVFAAYETWNRRIGTGALNRFLVEAISAHTPPAPGGRRIKLRYMTQPNARPPTFVVFCSRPEDLPVSYTRYLVNGLRDAFDLPGAPIRLHMRKGKNPYKGGS